MVMELRAFDLMDLETERLYNEFVTEREKLIQAKPIKRDKPARRYITLLKTEEEELQEYDD